MDLDEKYNDILHKAKIDLANGVPYADTLIDDDTDSRRGLTVLIRPNKEILENMSSVLSEFIKQDANQYFYPISDMHITVMSIISCYSDFNISTINTEAYIDIIKDSIQNIEPFTIDFKGITASINCVMTKGFYPNNSLDLLRINLRTNFTNSNLEQSLDKRYKIDTAHSTILRLRKPLKDIDTYLQLIDKYKDFEFGSMQVDEIELVYNDWYQRQKNTISIYKFGLKSN